MPSVLCKESATGCRGVDWRRTCRRERSGLSASVESTGGRRTVALGQAGVPPEGGQIVGKRRQLVGNEEIAFADEQKRIAHEEIAFPDEQKRIAREEIAFPDCGLRSGSLLPMRCF